MYLQNLVLISAVNLRTWKTTIAYEFLNWDQDWQHKVPPVRNVYILTVI